MLDLFQKKREKSIKDSPKISAIKAVTWRIVGTFDTILISYFLTGEVSTAIKIGGVEVVTKMFLYFLHERLWSWIIRKID